MRTFLYEAYIIPMICAKIFDLISGDGTLFIAQPAQSIAISYVYSGPFNN